MLSLEHNIVVVKFKEATWEEVGILELPLVTNPDSIDAYCKTSVFPLALVPHLQMMLVWEKQVNKFEIYYYFHYLLILYQRFQTIKRMTYRNKFILQSWKKRRFHTWPRRIWSYFIYHIFFGLSSARGEVSLSAAAGLRTNLLPLPRLVSADHMSSLCHHCVP